MAALTAGTFYDAAVPVSRLSTSASTSLRIGATVGLAVTSHVTNRLAKAEFEDLVLQP